MIRLRATLVIAFVLSGPIGCLAQSATSAPATEGSRPKSSEPAKPLPPPLPPAMRTGAPLSSGDPHVDEILDRLETRGNAIKGLKCDLIYKFVDKSAAVPSEQIKEGTLLYAKADPNARFLIHFTKLISDEMERKNNEFWAFDGQWLTERNDKTDPPSVIKRQIARPGERMDPFKLGKGPFPLPMGQKRADILENFTVRLEKFTLGDPRGSEHLYCVPRPDTNLAKKYSKVDIFVDRASEMPVRIVTERVSDANRIEVDFKSIDTGAAPAISRFTIEIPKGAEVHEEPLEEGGSGALP